MATAADAVREGRGLGARGDFAGAAKVADNALKRWPDDAELHLLRAAVAERLADFERVVQHVERFEALAPDRDPPDTMMGWALLQLGRAEDAQARLERAVQRTPGNATSWTNLGLARKQVGDIPGAIECHRRARELAPDRPSSYLNLAGIELDHGSPEGALRELAELRRLDPRNLDATRLEAMLHLYLDSSTPELVAALHRRAGSVVQSVFSTEAPRFVLTRAPDRVLRVAFVSPDFKHHSVASFLLPLIEALDRARIQPLCYHLAPIDDEITRRFRAISVFRDVAHLGDRDLVQRVRDDRVDIAIDLAGLTHGGRLTAFAARLAPIQVTWLGYPGTTGLPQVDARFVDSVTDPSGSESLCTEQLVRLDPVFVCWRSRVDAPLPKRQPLNGRPLTFASFNDLAKLSDAALDAWARILAAVPGSGLLVKAYGLRFERARERLLEELSRRGVDPGRVELLAYTATHEEHLSLYGRADIALDTFPYNGTTTTLEALWMGTPVVTVTGRGHQARVGASLLGALGRADLVAPDVETYVERAVELARNPDRLAADHAGLRDVLERSPLCDAAGLARRFEQALRALWRSWCRGR